MQEMNQGHLLVVPAGKDHDLAGPLRQQLLQIVRSAIHIQRPVGRIHRTVVEGMNQPHEVIHVRPVLGEHMDVVVDQRMALAQSQRGVEVAGVEDDQGLLFTHRCAVHHAGGSQETGAPLFALASNASISRCTRNASSPLTRGSRPASIASRKSRQTPR